MRPTRGPTPGFFAVLALFLTGAPPHPSNASPMIHTGFRNTWMYLGEATLTSERDHGRITAKAYTRTFSDVQLRVRKHAVGFQRLRIHFADGEVQDVPFEHVLPARGVSRTFDLTDGDRSIEAIELWYDAESLEGEALVLVYGRG